MGQSLILNGATSTIKKKKTIKKLDWGKILFKNWIIILKNFKHQKTEKTHLYFTRDPYGLYGLYIPNCLETQLGFEELCKLINVIAPNNFLWVWNVFFIFSFFLSFFSLLKNKSIIRLHIIFMHNMYT